MEGVLSILELFAHRSSRYYPQYVALVQNPQLVPLSESLERKWEMDASSHHALETLYSCPDILLVGKVQLQVSRCETNCHRDNEESECLPSNLW